MNDTLTGVLTQAVFAYVLMAFIAVICAVIIQLIVVLLARTQQPAIVVAPPLAVSAKPAVDESAMTAAVIAAAVHAFMGAHRIISLTEAADQSAWAHEMRVRHHISHAPHR
jgi:succinate dehydrogenase hydrophobic anchor subunit